MCWIREASLVFGSTNLALGTVLAVFFLGLALGSLVIGRLTPALQNSLRPYAALELGVALLALVSPWIFALLDGAYGALYPRLFDQPAALALVRSLLVAVILLPPTFLMGGTLPLFCRAYVVRRDRVAAATGALYAANTLGGVAGAALAGLVLVPLLGVRATLVIGALASAAAAAVAWTVGRRAATAPTPAPGAEPRSSAGSRSAASEHAPAPVGRRIALALACGVGFTALAGEVLWTRYLSLHLNGTVENVAVTLTVTLLGIVLGALLAARVGDGPLGSPAGFGALQVTNACVVLGTLLLPPAAWRALGDGLGVQLVLLLPPATLSGACFPVLARWAVRNPGLAGADVGRLAALNLAGGVAGSVLSAFVVLPRLGLTATARGVTGLSVAMGVAAWTLLARQRVAGALASVAAVAAWLALPSVLPTRLPDDFLRGDTTLLAVREGATSHLAVVRRDGIRQLEIDRWWQGQSGRTHQVLAAHLPLLFAPQPRRVLVVGVGAGQTAARFLDYPIERLDAVDVEPAVFDVIARWFDAAWMRDARVRLLRDDGRNLVTHTDRRYDLISLELGQLFRAGVESFYTDEFYRRAAERLAPGGVVSQFVPASFLTPDELRRVIATFIARFPNAALFYNTSELLLVGRRDGPIELTGAALDRFRAAIRRSGDGAYSHWGGPEHAIGNPPVLLGCFLVGEAGLRALGRGAPLLRDDRPLLAYRTPAALRRPAGEDAIVAALRPQLAPVITLLGPGATIDTAAAAAIRELDLRDLEASARLRSVEATADRTGEAVLATIDEAIRLNPANVRAHRFRGDAMVYRGRLDDAIADYQRALAISPDDPPARRGLGAALLMSRRPQPAIDHLRVAVAARPEDAEAANNLGVALGQTGDIAGAAAAFAQAVRLRPDDAEARRNLEQARAALGRALRAGARR